jgi:hypothetical protein
MAITDGCTVQEIDRAQLVRELLLDGVNGIGERRL